MDDIKFKCKVVDRYCTFKYLLNYVDIKFPSEDKISCFCPFHDNTDTEASILNKNAEGETLFCFAEDHLYRPHDLLSNYSDIVPFTLNQVFNAIWERLSEDAKAELKAPQKFNKPSSPFKSFYNDYHQGKLTYLELLNKLKSY